MLEKRRRWFLSCSFLFAFLRLRMLSSSQNKRYILYGALNDFVFLLDGAGKAASQYDSKHLQIHNVWNLLRWNQRHPLHVPSMSPFYVPFQNGFNADLWCCLHIPSKRSKMPLIKTVTLTVRVNEHFLCCNKLYWISKQRISIFKYNNISHGHQVRNTC